MQIMDKVLKDTSEIWDRCVRGSFLQDMMRGNLDKKKFLDYIVQDSLYLRDYLKAYALAISKCDAWRDMQELYSVMGFVNDSENATRLKYLQDYGMTDDDVEKVPKRDACAAYTDFLVETAKRESVPEILMAVMPCMIGYNIVFNKVRTLAPTVLDGYCGALVADYSSEFYQDSCARWVEYVNGM